MTSEKVAEARGQSDDGRTDEQVARHAGDLLRSGCH